MEFPENLKYSKEHEWTRVESNRAIIGITDFAQDELGEIVFIDLPAAGTNVEAMETFGTIESVKTVSDLFSSVSGQIVEVNSALEDEPEFINNDPYGDGWIMIVEMSDPNQLDDLLNASEYQNYIEEEKQGE